MKCFNTVLCFLVGSLLFIFENNLNAQCTVPMQPQNVTVTEVTPGSGDGWVSLNWDVDVSNNRTECGANESLFWYVGFYGQNSPAQNGSLAEYGNSTALFCGADAVTAPISTGGDVFGDGSLCIDQKGSTCGFYEMGQNVGNETHTWNVTGMNAYLDGGGDFQFNLCPGQCYNVYVWELTVGNPNGSGCNATAFGTGGTNTTYCDVEKGIACNGGELTLLAESPVSSVARICISGTNNPIEPPRLEIVQVVNPTCGVSAGSFYQGNWQVQPEDAGTLTDTCDPQDIDNETPYNVATTNIDDSSVSGTIVTPGSNGGDVDVTFVGAGGNSSSGTLQLGAHVVEVNCIEEITVGFSTPTGCGGTFPVSNPVCSYSDPVTTQATVYISNNGTPVGPNSGPSHAACVLAGDTNNGMDGTQECAFSLTGYPSNYSAIFNNYIDTENNCNFALFGNPFAGGSSPFDLPGTVTQDFGDGIMRSVSNICIRYEDPCDGSKSATCVKFISDASPIVGVASATDETCAGAANGKLTITGLAGGSPDPNGNGDLTDDGVGSYVITGSPSAFSQVAPGVWETANDVAPGSYTVTISDPNAACGGACDLELDFVVRQKLPSSISGNVAICPDECQTVTAVLQENPIVNYPIAQSADVVNDIFGTCPNPDDGDPNTSPDFGATSVFITPSNPNSPDGSTPCSSTIGPGAADMSIERMCFTVTSPDWSLLEIEMFDGDYSGWEMFWLGSFFVGGTDTGAGTMTFCSDQPIGNVYDGVFDGVTTNLTLGSGFTDNSFFILRVGVFEDGNGVCPEFTIDDFTVEYTDRCIEPQTATICLPGDDTTDGALGGDLTWAFNSGPADILGNGLTLDGAMNNQEAEACETGGNPAPGDYVYDVSGFHVATGSNPQVCCPISGQVTVAVRNSPTPPIPTIANGTEYCSSDAAAPLAFTPALSTTPGSVILANHTAGGFPNEWLAGLYDSGGTFIAGSDILAAGINCGGSAGDGPGLVTDIAAMTNLAPGTYQLAVGESFGDGLDGEVFTITDHCGNVLTTEADHAGACDAANTFTISFTVGAETLVVAGDGITVTADPDGTPGTGDESYEFDPAIANQAGAGTCGENLVSYTLTTSCGCVVSETIALFVYDDIIASTASIDAVCASGGDYNIAMADMAALLSGGAGAGNYFMSYNDGTNTVTDAPLANITIPAGATGPITVTISSDPAYTGMIVDPTDDAGTAMLACDGNACNTTFDIVLPACCAANNGSLINNN